MALCALPEESLDADLAMVEKRPVGSFASSPSLLAPLPFPRVAATNVENRMEPPPFDLGSAGRRENKTD